MAKGLFQETPGTSLFNSKGKRPGTGRPGTAYFKAQIQRTTVSGKCWPGFPHRQAIGAVFQNERMEGDNSLS
jgi:hypothetical protein